MAKTRVFVDTNIVIEAFRISIWNSVTARFALETVDTCVAEAQTGSSALAPGLLSTSLAKSHGVSRLERAGLVLASQNAAYLDDGERDLFARLLADGGPSSALLIATADKAAILVANNLGWLESVISLEKLAKQAGVSNAMLAGLETHFTEDWLSIIRTKIVLGVIP
jgi:predicted nucleic acid-binding protein